MSDGRSKEPAGGSGARAPRVLHVVAGLSPRSGGYPVVILGLGEAEARAGVDTWLYGPNGDYDKTLDFPVGTTFDHRGMHVRCFPLSFPRRLGVSRQMLRETHSAAGSFDLLHVHGTWFISSAMGARAARRAGVPCIWTVHGMLHPEALKPARRRKAVFGALLLDRHLRRADCVHAGTTSEMQSIRAYGFRGPVAVIPNGIDPGKFDDLARHGGRLAALHPQARDRRVALFMGRMHPMKGVPQLLEAWARVRKDFPDWLLVMGGPDRHGYQAGFESQAAALGIGDSVLFTGPLFGDDWRGAVAAADIFASPTLTEGFSMAVLEAMGCGLPVLITRGCSFPEVATHGAGVIVAPTADGTEAGLRQLMAMPDASRRAMGAHGRQLVEDAYTWDSMASRMVGVYEWLLGRRGRPECVSD